MLPCICPVIDHRGRQNVVRTSVTHSAIASCATFLFLPHFDVVCDLLLDRCTTTRNLFLKQNRFLETSHYARGFETYSIREANRSVTNHFKIILCEKLHGLLNSKQIFQYALNTTRP